MRVDYQKVAVADRLTFEGTMPSGSERLRAKAEAQKAELESRYSRDKSSSSMPHLMAIAKVIQETISLKEVADRPTLPQNRLARMKGNRRR
ncbi:unnamed protein product [Euphydryas editha]|uniref:Uncharacterized protein n=1 Tax=Euphydryas editha TaxID=104508 RepID=A0AAU9V249_EUPED|nr:unnamed protein product [Euphydryas editha]